MRIGMLDRFLTTKEQIVLMGIGATVCLGCVTLLATRSARSDEQPMQDAIEPPDVVSAVGAPKMGAMPSETPVPEASLVRSETDAPAQDVTVAIAGAVETPGVYTLASGARVNDLVEAADGLVDDADVRDINMAAELINGSTLTIPIGAHAAVEGDRLVMRGAPPQVVTNPPEYTISGWTQEMAANETESPVGSSALRGTGNALVDINRASQAELETLPGIGPVKARKIMEYRSQQPFRSVDELEEVRGIGPKTLENLRSLVAVGAS